MGGAWKVAYADFVTAMMAFFLLMWILNMTSPETKAMLAGMFKNDSYSASDLVVPIGISNNPLIEYAGAVDPVELKMTEAEKTNVEIMRNIKEFMLKDAVLSSSSGLTSDGIGVLLSVTPAALFKPNSIEFTTEGESILNEIVNMLNMYKTYLVVRGHTDPRETGAPLFQSKWELSAARANAAIRYLVAKQIDPTHLRSVAYADTRPAVGENEPNALERNARLEFHFHRPDTMSTVVGY